MSRKPLISQDVLLAAIPQYPHAETVQAIANRVGISNTALRSRLIKLTYLVDPYIVEDDQGRIAKIEQNKLLGL